MNTVGKSVDMQPCNICCPFRREYVRAGGYCHSGGRTTGLKKQVNRGQTTVCILHFGTSQQVFSLSDKEEQPEITDTQAVKNKN